MTWLRIFQCGSFLFLAGSMACGDASRSVDEEAVTGPAEESIDSSDEALVTPNADSTCTENTGPAVARPQGYRGMSFTGDNAWAAQGRWFHSAVWTGTRMIVFGGDYGKGQPGFEGASYDPLTDRWSRIAASPLARRANHAAAWTGKEMLIWGGNVISSTGSYSKSNRGARFDPSACKWTEMAPGPVKWRAGSTVIYATTTHELIMFGGLVLGTSNEFSRYGYAYDVDTNTWRKTAPAPIAGRQGHGAIWTGSRMIVFGGEVVQNGGVTTSRRAAVYDPATDTWDVPVAPEGGLPTLDLAYYPAHRRFRQAQERIDGVYASLTVNTPGYWYGGYSTDSNSYARSGAWFENGNWIYFPAYQDDAPARQGMASWAAPGGKFFFWGGASGANFSQPELNSGSYFDVVKNSWYALPTPPSSLPARRETSVVWTGEEAILWGGWNECGQYNCVGYIPGPAGAVYRP